MLKPQRLVLYSPHTRAECAKRLSAALGADFKGEASEVDVVVRKRIRYSNSFQTLFMGRMQPVEGGTKLMGNLGVSPTVAVLVVFITLALAATTCWFLVSAVRQVQAGAAVSELWIGMVAPPVMLLLTLGLVAVGRWLARDEAGEVTTFLKQTLDAGENPSEE